MAAVNSVNSISGHRGPVQARPKAKRKSLIHRYARQDHHPRGLNPHLRGLTGSSMAANECLRPSHVLDMTESRFSPATGILAALIDPVSSGVGGSVVTSEIRCGVGDVLLIVREDVVEAEAA